MKPIVRFLLACVFFVFSVFIFCLLLIPAFAMRVRRSYVGRPVIPGYVFCGMDEIANNLGELTATLRQKGVVVLRAKQLPVGFYNDEAVNFLRYKLLSPLERFFRVYYLFWIICKADQVWLVWYTSILSLNMDYVLYRLAGVDLVVQHCGDDVRCRHLHDALFDHYTPGIRSGPYVRHLTRDMLLKFYRQFMAESFAKTLSIRNQATFQRAGLGFFFFSQRQLCEFSREPNVIPIIIHAPSDRAVKRTDIVLDAIDILRHKEIDFDFRLLEGVNNSKVLQELCAADIVIDQPATWPARFAIEAASASCAVISGSHYSFIGLPPNPTIQFPRDARALAAIIEKLVVDRKYLSRLMAESWVFWQTNYSERVFWDKYLQVWQGTYETFPPLSDQKEILLSAARGKFQRFFIRFFYHPIANGSPKL